MKNITTAQLPIINSSPSGAKPVFILEIEWDSVVKDYYCTEPVSTITGITVYPSIIKFGKLVVCKQKESVYNYQNVSVTMTMDDSNNLITRINNYDVLIGKKCTLYLHYQNDAVYALSDLTTILIGKMEDVSFSNDLTVSFTISTLLPEVSIKQDSTVLNKENYPLVFGKVRKVPVVEVEALAGITWSNPLKTGWTTPFNFDVSDNAEADFWLGINPGTVNTFNHDCFNGYLYNEETLQWENRDRGDQNGGIEIGSNDRFAQLPRSSNGNLLIRIAYDEDLDEYIAASIDEGTEYFIYFSVSSDPDRTRLLERYTPYCDFGVDETRMSNANIESDRPNSSVSNAERLIIIKGKFRHFNDRFTVDSYWIEVTDINPIIPHMDSTDDEYPISLIAREEDDLDGTHAYIAGINPSNTPLVGRIVKITDLDWGTYKLKIRGELRYTTKYFFVTDYNYDAEIEKAVITLFPLCGFTEKRLSSGTFYGDDDGRSYYLLNKLWFSCKDLVDPIENDMYGASGKLPDTLVTSAQDGMTQDGVNAFNAVFQKYCPYGVLGVSPTDLSYFYVYSNDEEESKWGDIKKYNNPNPANRLWSAKDYFNRRGGAEELENLIDIPSDCLDNQDYWSVSIASDPVFIIYGYRHLSDSINVINQIIQDWDLGEHDDGHIDEFNANLAKLDFLIPSSRPSSLNTYLGNRRTGAAEFMSHILVPSAQIITHQNFIETSNEKLNKIRIPKAVGFGLWCAPDVIPPITGEPPTRHQYVCNLYDSNDVSLVSSKSSKDVGDTTRPLIENTDWTWHTANNLGINNTITGIQLVSSVEDINPDYSGVYADVDSKLPNNPIDIIMFLLNGKLWNGSSYTQCTYFNGFMPDVVCDTVTFGSVRSVYFTGGTSAGTYAARTTAITLVDFDVSKLVPGNIIKFSNHSTEYTITSFINGVLTIPSPGLVSGIVNTTTVQIYAHPICNFALLEPKDVLTVVNDLAKISLCALIFGGLSVKIKYIGVLPTVSSNIYFQYPVIDLNTVSYTLQTKTELCSELICEYVTDYIQSNKSRLKIKNTLNNQSIVHDCYMITDPREIKKVNNRLFNTLSEQWVYVEFDSVFLSLLFDFYDALYWVHGKESLSVPPLSKDSSCTSLGEIVEMDIDYETMTTRIKLLLNRTLYKVPCNLRWSENYNE